MQSVTTLNLNLQHPNYTVVAHAVQNDRLARKIEATLADGDAAWTPPSGSDGVVRFRKPDGTMGFYDVDEANNTAVTWTGNVATIILAEQVLTVPGDVYCQINFYNTDAERLSTFAFIIKVQECAITDETIVSTDYFNVLSAQISAILAIIDDFPEPSTSTPLMDGTGSTGSETTYARGDHRHPRDTTLAPKASPTFTGTPKAPTASAGTNTTQIATTAFVGTAISNLPNVSTLTYVEVTS